MYIPNVQRAVFHINMTGRNVITLKLMQMQIYKEMTYALCPFVYLMMFNATLNNNFSYIVAVSFIDGENHPPVARHGQTLSHNVVHLAP